MTEKMPRQPTRRHKDPYGGAENLWKTAYWHAFDIGDLNASKWWATDNAVMVTTKAPRPRPMRGWVELADTWGHEQLLLDADPRGDLHPGPFATRYSKVVAAGTTRMGRAGSPTGPAFVWRGDRLIAVVMPERVMPSGRGAKKPRLTSFQKRFKYIHDTYPPQVFVALFEAAMGSQDGLFADLEFGVWTMRYELVREAVGFPAKLPKDATEADAAKWLLDELLAGRHYSDVPVPTTSELEPILPWAAARLNRILRKPDPKDLPRRAHRGGRPPNYPHNWPQKQISGVDRWGRKYGAESTTGEWLPEGTVVTVPPVRWGNKYDAILADGRVIPFDRHPFTALTLNPEQWARQAGAWNLRHRLHEIAHWHAATHTDLGRLTHRQVLHRQARWHGGAARGLGPGKTAHGGVKVADVDKWSLWHLTTSDAIRSEGAAMGHCLGKVSDQFQRLHSGQSSFYSLRDDKGQSRISFEVLRGKREGQARIAQAKGPGNRYPGVKKSIGNRVDRSSLSPVDALEGFARRARSRVIDWEEIEKLEQVVTEQGPSGTRPFQLLPQMYGHRDGVGLSLMWRLRDGHSSAPCWYGGFAVVDNWRQIGQGKPMPVPKGRSSRRRRRRR